MVAILTDQPNDANTFWRWVNLFTETTRRDNRIFSWKWIGDPLIKAKLSIYFLFGKRILRVMTVEGEQNNHKHERNVATQ